MKRIVGILVICIMLLSLLTSCGLDVPKPAIKSGEFDFSITYEFGGETNTVSGVYACKYAGLGFALDGGFLSFSREELSFLYRYAEGLGERFLCEEETAVTEALGALSALIAEESEEKKKSYKRRRTLILTGTGMLLLLLV